MLEIVWELFRDLPGDGWVVCLGRGWFRSFHDALEKTFFFEILGQFLGQFLRQLWVSGFSGCSKKWCKGLFEGDYLGDYWNIFFRQPCKCVHMHPLFFLSVCFRTTSRIISIRPLPTALTSVSVHVMFMDWRNNTKSLSNIWIKEIPPVLIIL